MDGADLRTYLLALPPKGQESFRGVLKRDRVIRRRYPPTLLTTPRGRKSWTR